jgi:hypothetical protein
MKDPFMDEDLESLNREQLVRTTVFDACLSEAFAATVDTLLHGCSASSAEQYFSPARP